MIRTFLDEIVAWDAADTALKPIYDRMAGNPMARIERYGRCLQDASSRAHPVDGGSLELWDGGRLVGGAYVTRDELNRSVLVVFGDVITDYERAA